MEIRLLKTYELIINKTLPSLNEVMFSVGLNSRSYFNNAFKKRFGIKPGQLEKRNKLQKTTIYTLKQTIHTQKNHLTMK